MIPFVTIELDKPYNLKFDMQAMLEFEQTTKTKVMDLLDGMSATECLQVLCAMLRRIDNTIDLEKTIELVENSPKDFVYIMVAVTDAVTVAFKNSEKQSPNAKRPRANI